ncbi:ABC transporter permease [Camelliibacillus cellulosilyticus]|uniref:ABC transporter permease n=1 Tax=Camelliibacillus cellulosilyticus TaxID=2174486 RepID=A0ABV9GKS6_9BACL
MLRFIWRNWLRHKERFILMLIGALIISSGLSYLLGLSETSQGTIVDILKKNWKAQYHILVRPLGSRSPTENQELLSPNYLSGLNGGITVDQWNEIKKMKDIDVAAPLATIGYANYVISYLPDHMNLSPDGIYRISLNIKSNNGAKTNVYHETYYIKGNRSQVNRMKVSGYLLLAGIDPDEESKLVGLNQSILKNGNSRYFTDRDKSTISYIDSPDDTYPPNKDYDFPVIINNRVFNDTSYEYNYEKLNMTASELKEFRETEKKENKIIETMDDQKKWTLIDHLWKSFDHIKGESVAKYTYRSQDYYSILLKKMSDQPIADKNFDGQIESNFTISNFFTVGGVNYRDVKSPFPERWPYGYDVLPAKSNTNIVNYDNRFKDGYRNIKWFWNYDSSNATINVLNPKVIGVFDTKKLHIAKNPLTKLPMETYRPPTAELVLDEQKRPVNPPVTILPDDLPTGFLQEPPSMLTTIDAATQILGEKPISSIRVKVKGVNDLSKASQDKLEKVAKEIEQKTGLITDITLGSSPEPTLLHIPASGKKSALGWVEMPWIHLGTTFTIYKETNVGFSGIIASVMLVAVAFVFATNLVSFLARRKEFAILLAIGWRPSQLVRMVFSESLMIGAFVAMIAWIIEAVYFLSNPAAFSIVRFILVGLLGLVIYLLGAVGPSLLASRLKPYEAITTGEVRATSRRVFKSAGLVGMSINHLMGKVKRNLLSVFSMAFPTMLLAFFLFVSIRMKGVLYTTWLGQYAALHVTTSHYIAMGVALVIAILTTAEIMWQNVVERKPEIAILKAVGWRHRNVRGLVLLEGLWVGVAAGLISILLSLALIGLMYHQFPIKSLWLILVTGGVPLAVGILGSIIPAEVAVRTNPLQAMNR